MLTNHKNLQYHLVFFVSNYGILALTNLMKVLSIIIKQSIFLLFAIRFELPWLYMDSIDNLAINYIENKREAHVVHTLSI